MCSLVTCCYQCMTILRNLYPFHVPLEDMVNIYCLYIRSVAEQSSVVWSSSIHLERTPKVALRIILKDDYIYYRNALFLTNLETHKARRSYLGKVFATKCTKTDLARDKFLLKVQTVNARNPEKYEVTKAKTSRLTVSALPSMRDS